MNVHPNLCALSRSIGRASLRQPTPHLAPIRREREPSGFDQPDAVAHRTDYEVSLVHLLDLRRRYRDEATTMRQGLQSLQATLEASSHELCHHLTTGQCAPVALRKRCDDLVVAVEAAERDIADIYLAIDGIGQEVTHLVAVRQRRGTP